MKKYLLFFVSLPVLFAACAGSSKDSDAAERAKADAARARANAAYSTLDASTESSQVAPVQTQKTAPNVQGLKTVQGNMLMALQNEYCKAENEFRGIGVADNLQAAKLAAQKDIGSQIQSSVTAETRSVTSGNTDASGKMTHAESISQNIRLNTHLENAQDAKVVSVLYNGNEYGVVACMTMANAAKPFLIDFKVLQDSLNLAVQTFEHQVHPVEKQQNYERALDLFLRYKVVKNFLNSLDNAAGYDASAETSFATMQQAYVKFRSEYAIHFNANESPYLNAVFAAIAKLAKIQKSECSAGLCLNAEISEPACKEGSLGISCSVNVSLSGASASGETFFNLQASVKGAGRYEEAEALEKLQKNLLNGDWAAPWKPELDKWNLK